MRRIMDVSLKLFLEKGFEQTTVLDIVDNLGGLTRGAFYHHFKSKEEVLEAIFKTDSAENSPYTIAYQVPVSNGSERLKLAWKIALQSKIENDHQVEVWKFGLSVLSNPRFLAESLKETKKDAEQMAAIMEEGMADGSLKKGNAKIISELFLLLISVWMMPAIFEQDKEEMLAKIALIEQITIGLGYNFIDDELRDLFINLVNIMNNPNVPYENFSNGNSSTGTSSQCED